jgi:hypothetical protein
MTRDTIRSSSDKVDARWAKLRAKIECHAPFLRKQGDVVLKKIKTGHYWYLRFLLPPGETGRRRHKSIYICSDTDKELLTRTRQLLGYYRAQRKLVKEVHAAAHFARALTRLLRRQNREISRLQRRNAARA